MANIFYKDFKYGPKIYLTKKEIWVLYLRHNKHLNFLECGDIMGVSRTRSRELETRALIKIKDLMTIFGFELKD